MVLKGGGSHGRRRIRGGGGWCQWVEWEARLKVVSNLSTAIHCLEVIFKFILIKLKMVLKGGKFAKPQVEERNVGSDGEQGCRLSRVVVGGGGFVAGGGWGERVINKFKYIVYYSKFPITL